MVQEERRKKPRVNSLNLLSYLCMDENDEVVMQGVGRTLTVSQGGILLETHAPIDPGHAVSLVIAIENDLVDVKGKVVYSSTGKEGRFNTGIQFVEPDETILKILKESIAAFGQDE